MFTSPHAVINVFSPASSRLPPPLCSRHTHALAVSTVLRFPKTPFSLHAFSYILYSSISSRLRWPVSEAPSLATPHHVLLHTLSISMLSVFSNFRLYLPFIRPVIVRFPLCSPVHPFSSLFPHHSTTTH